MRVVTFKVDEDLLEKLDTYAKLRKKTRSEVIREAIVRLLKEEEPRLAPKPKVIRIHG